jgi:hypothetical protein
MMLVLMTIDDWESQWSDGRWSMVDGQWSMVNGQKGNGPNFAPPRQNAGKPVLVFDLPSLNFTKNKNPPHDLKK